MTIKAYQSPQPRLQFTDSSGNFLNGGQLFIYAAGTLTKITTYQDAGEVTPNTNPIVLDSVGRTPAGLFVPPGTFFKMTLAPSTDTDPPTNPIWTVDNLGTAVNGAPYAADTGSINAMVATVVGLPTVATAGASAIINPANANTGPATINVNGWGNISIRNPMGFALGPQALQAGCPLPLTYDGTYWRMSTFAPGDSYGVDTGTADAMVVTIPALPTSLLVTGSTFYVKAAASAAGSATVTLNSCPAATLSTAAGNAMTTNSYVTAQVFSLTYDGTHMRTTF